MKILDLQISNILSFKHHENISEATKITFNDQLNLFIGENGAGKSTALEVINFLFKKVLFTQFNVNLDLYARTSEIQANQKNKIIAPGNNNKTNGFRLEPNWNTEDKPQIIRMRIQLDEIDKSNIEYLNINKEKLSSVQTIYSTHNIPINPITNEEFLIEVNLNSANKTFSSSITPDANDPGYLYLVNYNFYKELITFHNIDNPGDQISPLFESFTLIGGYRNYHAFNPNVSVSDSTADKQIQDIKTREYSKSLNANEQNEPIIFNLVRLRIANKHYELYGEEFSGDDSEEEANNQPFLNKINNKLKLVNLNVKIKFTNKQKWSYSFQFFDLKRNQPLADINSLSAGQKAIIHLVFEAYGRGDVKGGVVIIDEPEIHLHYQFQNEYLKIINEINEEQKCQYVLVTHSESLINSSTIHMVKRFTLNQENNTIVKSPILTIDEKTLIKILDNTRSTYAFFAKKVLLVEGETDRYFFKTLLQQLYPNLNQEIAILDIIGKGQYEKWKSFFESFGLSVYFIGDLDAAFGFLYPMETAYKLHTSEIVAGFKCTHPNLEIDIESKYLENIYVLKQGDLEHYLSIHNKGIAETITFCNESLGSFINDTQNSKVMELKTIMEKITID